jgi:hypothetical protein
MKVFGLTLGMMAMSFAFFVGNPAYAQEVLPEEDDWICCLRSYGIGCKDKGGVFWPYDMKIPGALATCTIR